MFEREFAASNTERALALGWRILLAIFLAVVVLKLINQQAVSAILLGLLAILLILDAAMLAQHRTRAEIAPTIIHPEDAQRLHRIEALLDVVTVALFVLTPDGRISYANRAARRIAGHEVRLAAIPGFGLDAATVLEALKPGERRIVTLQDERLILAWAGAFTEPGGSEQHLLSVQLVVGGLDAVQLGAWHSMARVLAHEMMNSLTPITSLTLSLAATARERQLSPEVVTALETIAQRSENLLRFVERYRAFAEVPKPLVRPIDTRQFLQGVLLLLRDTAGVLQVRLEQAPKALPASFDADPELLEQALLNLLLNAIDAVADRPNGEVLLRASVEGQTFAFEVWDNGPGVPLGLLEEVFVPFFTTKHGGSGIGLSLARQIAIAHGGSLTGRHRPDGGMIFRMTVPNDLLR